MIERIKMLREKERAIQIGRKGSSKRNKVRERKRRREREKVAVII